MWQMLRISWSYPEGLMMTRFALLGAGVALAVAARPDHYKSQKTVIQGFSVKRHVLGQKVYNSEGELVGKIEDLILAKKVITHAVIGVGRYLGLATYVVAIPVADFTRSEGKIVLPGGSKDAILAMPRFE
jgi:sporulation protein YlmC with PRC-barrel domain